jgi:hypothetical protein
LCRILFVNWLKNIRFRFGQLHVHGDH